MLDFYKYQIDMHERGYIYIWGVVQNIIWNILSAQNIAELMDK